MPGPTSASPGTGTSSTAGPSRHSITLYLCRHGETSANALRRLQGSGINGGLNERGWKQAEALAKKFVRDGVRLDLVASSHLKRAVQTAQVILDAQASFTNPSHDGPSTHGDGGENMDNDEDGDHHPPRPPSLIHLPTLREISWGSYEGLTYPPLQPLHTAWHHGNFLASPPSGESPLAAWQRAKRGIADVLLQARAVMRRRDRDVSVCVVCHGRLLRIVLSAMVHKSLFFMGTFLHRNTAVNVLRIEPLVDHEEEKIKWVRDLDEEGFVRWMEGVVKCQAEHERRMDMMGEVGRGIPSPPPPVGQRGRAAGGSLPCGMAGTVETDADQDRDSTSTTGSSSSGTTSVSSSTTPATASDPFTALGDRLNLTQAPSQTQAYFTTPPSSDAASGIGAIYEPHEEPWCGDERWKVETVSLNNLSHIWE